MTDRIRETLAFEDLSSEEKASRHILGRLYGPIADVVRPTRNGRKYSEQLWENVFNNPIMKEKFKNKVMYGELGHPEDRTEVDMEKIAVSMPEAPKKDKDGKLIAYLDILDTPNGRILKTLCDYGSTLGISSRGTGDVYTDDDGEEAVDPDTYDCECFDIVLVPAVESARLTFTEGLHKEKTMKQALTESLKNASEEDRRVMTEALNNLDIKLDSNSEESENIEEVTSKQTNEEPEEATDNGSEELIKSLQEALKDKLELENRVKTLQEELAVSNAKVDKLEDDIEKNKSTILRLTSLAKDSRTLTKKVSSLEEELKTKTEKIETLTKEANTTKDTSKLNEALSRKTNTIKKLTEDLDNSRKEVENLKSVNESLEKKLNDSSTKVEELKANLTTSEKYREGYKKLANKTISKYIEVRARNIGVKPEVIKEKLSKNYTLEEVDKVCENLMSYEIRASQLPYKVGKVTATVTTTEVSSHDDDDYVDETLIGVANTF